MDGELFPDAGAPAAPLAPSVELSDDQRAAFDAWRDSSAPEFTLGGLAGTGKTTLVGFIREECRRESVQVLTCAPTAKACVALRRRGVDGACTIHSALYDFAGFDKGESGRVDYRFDLKREGQDAASGLRGSERSHLRSRRGLVIVDEASMVDTRVAADLRARAPSILWCGDHGQLPPVGPDPRIMSRLDARLEKIHRQAVGSPIIELAHEIRRGRSLVESAKIVRAFGAEQVSVHSAFNGFGVANLAHEHGVDFAIVARNATRNMANKRMRELLFGAKPALLAAGDKLVGLKNNYPAGIVNGESYVVHRLENEGTDYIAAVLEREDGERKLVNVWKLSLGVGIKGLEEAAALLTGSIAVLDYGYALTCHKAQGSEAPRVLVFDEPVDMPGWDNVRWAYTAVTRAREKLIVASPRSSAT